MISEILDAWMDTRAQCASVRLFDGGIDAMRTGLHERADDVVYAAHLLNEYPETAAKLMRGAADALQQYARTVEIAVRVCATREHVDADCEHSEE